MSSLRPPSAAGFFYPSDPRKLQELIDGLLSAGKPGKDIPHPAGIIAPHAGYIYSGKTAAFAYNLIKDKSFKTIIIISPSHREYFPGVSVYNGEGYITPLGIVPVNTELADKIVSGSKMIFKGIQGHRDEHAIEVHLPFLQSVIKDFDIVPIVMGDQSKIYVDELSEHLRKVVTDDMLIIASTDLSHYHKRSVADSLDKIVEKRVADFNYEKLMEDLEQGRCEACGGGPVVVLMKVLHDLNKSKSIILNRTDSGEFSGDLNQVVGYLSAAIYN